jgi:hypothetical protein
MSVKEKKLRVTAVLDIPATHNRPDGWRLELDGPGGSWTELPRSKCAVAPQVGEEAVFICLNGSEIASIVMVCDRVYVSGDKK